MSQFARHRLLTFLFPLLLSLPFLNRAYFVDDSYFVEIAEWLVQNPEKPYDFKADDAGLQNRGWEEDGFVRMVNPLLHHYYMGLWIKWAGSREWVLRLGCLLLVCFSGLILFELARRWTRWPLLSACLVMATPAHWLTAHSLLIDSTMSLFFLAGLYFFIRSFEQDSLFLSILSGLFMGLAMLAKYPAVFALPLSASWLILNWKKCRHRYSALLAWSLALSILCAYSFWTWDLYGAPHILAASERMVRVFGWGKVFVFFVFLSGVSVVPILGWSFTKWKTMSSMLVLFLLLSLLLSSSFGGFTGLQACLLTFWFLTFFVWALSLLKMRKFWIYPRDHFLAVWVLGFIFMMILVMGWVAARYYLIVLPPLVFLAVRQVEINWGEAGKNIVKGMLGFLVVLSLSLAYADYNQAEPSRKIGNLLKEEGYLGGEGAYYLGDSFTMSYLKDYGWTPLFPTIHLKEGDLILSKAVTMPPIWNWKKKLRLRVVKTYPFPTSYPLKVMDYHGSAGFYASVWGALPFTMSNSPWEMFLLYEVISNEANIPVSLNAEE